MRFTKKGKVLDAAMKERGMELVWKKAAGITEPGRPIWGASRVMRQSDGRILPDVDGVLLEYFGGDTLTADDVVERFIQAFAHWAPLHDRHRDRIATGQ